MFVKSFLLLLLSCSFINVLRAETKSVSGTLAGVFPPEIKCVAVLTPASCPDKNRTLRAVSMLEEAGLKVKLMPYCFEKNGSGKYAGPSLEHRLEAWNKAVNDPEVDMIIPSRGGSGAQDLIEHIDWQKFRERKLILMGFSNITYITSAMDYHKAGHPIAGPNVNSFCNVTKKSLIHLKAVLAKKAVPAIKLVPLKKGDASGRVYAGHMIFLDRINSGKWKVDTSGRVLFIECVGRDTEAYKKSFDNMLKNGFFDKAAAVVFSHFTRVKDAENIDATFELWASKLKCPVYKGYPYGHANDNRALDFRSTAVIKDDVLTFK